MVWMKKQALLVGMASAGLTVAVLVPAFAMAQTPDATATATPSATGTAEAEDGDTLECGSFGPLGGLRIEVHRESLDDIAAALGVDVDTLEAAVETVREAQAPTERPIEPLTGEERDARQAEFQAALAAELGVSADDIAAAFEAAKAARLADVEARLAEAVASGDLTQEEANAILDRIESGERPGLRGGLGGRMHRQGGGEFFRFFRFFRMEAPDADGESDDVSGVNFGIGL